LSITAKNRENKL